MTTRMDDTTVTDDRLWSIVEQVWESLLDAPARPVDWSTGWPDEPLLSAEVLLSGDWAGAVSVTTSAAAAERMARTMLQARDDEQLEPADVNDAFGEIVNVVGGNVKALLDCQTRLGLPSAVPGPAPTRGRNVRRVLVGWHTSHVEVAVREIVDTEHRTDPDS